MNNTVLKNIGRPHTSEDIIEKYHMAQDIGIKTINMDLIAGLPGDSYESFCDSIDRVISLSPQNITVHTLSIKRGSRMNENSISFDESFTPIVENMLLYATQSFAVSSYKPYYLYRQKKMLGNFENIGYSIANHINIYNIMMMEETHSVIALGAGGVSRILTKNNNSNFNINPKLNLKNQNNPPNLINNTNQKPKKDIERVFNYKEPQLYIEDFPEIIKRKEKLIELLT
jgi:oxygen-independent coproporphyrinogen-3 oxidase